MKKIISLLLSLILLVSCFSLTVFAGGTAQSGDAGAELPELTENCTSLGTAFTSSESSSNPATNINDGDNATCWDAAGASESTVYFGINYTKEANIYLYEIEILAALGETIGNDKIVYKVELFRNNRWYEIATVCDDKAAPVGYDTYAEAIASGEIVNGRVTVELDKPVYTQQVRIIAEKLDETAAYPKVYEIELTGKVYENIALKGSAYASSFKHYEWTPPYTANDGNDFEEDWHGWEPQYPEVAFGAITSAGFEGEHLGFKFTNREYYEINEIVLYMSVHNSSANPSWGYQDTKYKVEALVEGEWITIAEFRDSDSVPHSYKDYDEAMKNDTGAYHIGSYYTIVPDTVYTTNNIRISISEFGKNYNGDGSLVFPYIYEVRIYGEQGDIPDVELPEGAVLSPNAAANSFPYASSAKMGSYPYLAVDGVESTGWTPKDLSANQTFGVRFDKTYTIDDVYVLFEDATFSAPFKIEALVNGQWTQVATGNISDCYKPLPEGVTYIAQEKTYEITPVQTNEIRIVFTEALTKSPRLNEVGANIVSAVTGFITNGVSADAVKNGDRNMGIKLNGKQTINQIAIDFKDTSSDIKYFVQAYVDGIWTTIHVENKLYESTFVHDVYVETDEIRIAYSDENAAPQIDGITLNTVNYSGDVSSYTKFVFPFNTGENTVVDVVYGKTYDTNKVIIDHGNTTVDCDFTVEGMVDGEWVVLVTSNVNSTAKEFVIDSVEVTELRVIYESTASKIPDIKQFAINVVGMKSFFMDQRYSVFQKQSAANGNLAVLGTSYSNSNYPSLSFDTYINDGQKHSLAKVWVPKLEEYSAGVDVYCGVKLDREYTVDQVVVIAGDIGNIDGVGNYFEIQALVNGQYIKVGEGNTCAKDREYLTAYKIDSVKTSDIRIVFTNTSIYMPTVLELEVYSNTDLPTPFAGHVKSEDVPAITVFETITPKFEVAGLPSNAK
ncbi:MAG: discoidin domain-containing protein [Clostridia bacterium]|nr:discoidin domain-containing protein [Clostridia bacterium]